MDEKQKITKQESLETHEINLSLREEKFCQLMNDGEMPEYDNKGKSAKKAGYSDKASASTGTRLWKKVKIRRRIAQIEAEHYKDNIATQFENLVVQYQHDRKMARENGQYGVAKDITTKLGELGNHFKQRVALETTVQVAMPKPREDMTLAEQEHFDREQRAILASASAYKRELAPGQGSISSFIPSIALANINVAPIETNDNHSVVDSDTPDKIDTSDEIAFEATERISAGEVGRGPRRPTHSRNDFE